LSRLLKFDLYFKSRLLYLFNINDKITIKKINTKISIDL